MQKKKTQRGKPSRPAESGMGGTEFIVLPPSGEVQLYHRLFGQVRDFLMERYPGPVQEAFNVFADVNSLEDTDLENEDFDDPVMIQFTDWIIHSSGVIKPKQTGIGLYLENSRKLGSEETDMLHRMNDSWVTLCELLLGESHNRVLFKDLLLGEEFDIRVEEDIPPFPEGLPVGVRVIPFSSGPGPGLGSYPFLTDKDYVLESFQEFYEEYREDNPESTLEEFLRNESPLLILWFDFIRELKEDEELDEAGDDEELTVYLSHFEYSDLREVRKRLKTIRDLHESQKNTFDWLGEADEDGEPELRGVLVLARGKLILSVVSEDLREAGKIMLLSSCRGLIRHVEDTVEETGADEY